MVLAVRCGFSLDGDGNPYTRTKQGFHISTRYRRRYLIADHTRHRVDAGIGILAGASSGSRFIATRIEYLMSLGALLLLLVHGANGNMIVQTSV